MTLNVKIIGFSIFIWFNPMWKWGDSYFRGPTVYFQRLNNKEPKH